MKVKVVRATVDNWYKVGEEYDVESKTRHRDGRDYYPLVDDANIGIGPEHCEIIEEKPKFPFKVRCINNNTWENELELGRVYDVVGENHGIDWFVDVDGRRMSFKKSRFEIVDDEDTTHHEGPVRNKYMREVKPGVWVDVYDVIRAWKVEDPCLQHLLKKALASGQRGHKDLKEDLDDILASAKRAVEMHEEWNGAKMNLEFKPIS
jgi:hypothetical protein